MTEQGFLSGNVRGYEIPNCSCRLPRVDPAGRVLGLETCPACQAIRLDVIRGGEYAIAYLSGGDTGKAVLMKQKEFFSFRPSS